MMHKVQSSEVDKRVNQNHRQRMWRNFVRVVACVVVFCTTYSLILPALTLEKGPCDLEEHTHTMECYQKVEVAESAALICSYESLGVHTHAPDCYDANGDLLCGRADYVNHQHDDSCRDDEGNVICQIPEKLGHAHGTDCYAEVAPVTEETETSHVHGESCYEVKVGELICELTETEGHTHGKACGKHVHDETCEKHVHDETCEKHVHDETCEKHVHDETCEKHAHDETCEESCTKAYACTKKAVCNKEYACTKEYACYIEYDNCDKQETGEGHTHGDACYEQISTLICTLEENVPAEAAEAATETEQELICKEPVAQTHVHNESCIAAKQAEAQNCTDADHEHTELCYGTWMLICEKEEHTHDLACQSDPRADVESEADWKATFADVELTGEPADVVAIAKTQLGYTESTRNYEVMEDGETTKGYTRYGAWYGDRYGDWCAMFASFCLHYAGMEGMPLDANCPHWIEQLEELELYHLPDAYMPKPGDLVFFDWDDDDDSDHVGIVAEFVEATETEPGKLLTIEGNSGNRVAEREYELDDETIMGYGEVMILEEEPITMLSYTGDDYEVVLRFDESAEIPNNAELAVTELTGEAYQEHMNRTREALGIEEKYSLIQLTDQDDSLAMKDEDQFLTGELAFARFFDITILVDGQEIEPASTVEVTVRYDSSVEIPEGTKTAVHFTNDGEIEVLEAEAAAEPVATAYKRSAQPEKSETETADESAFVFLQDSFSTTGTVIELVGNEEGAIGKPVQEMTNTTVEWLWNSNSESGTMIFKNLSVYTEFSKYVGEKTITIKVPTGMKILGYSAVGTTEKNAVTGIDTFVPNVDVQGVQEYPISPIYKVESSSLKAAEMHDNPVGEEIPDDEPAYVAGYSHDENQSWESQVLKNYASKDSKEGKNIPTHGGVLTYKLDEHNGQTVKVSLQLTIDGTMLSNTINSGKVYDANGNEIQNIELLKPIEITFYENVDVEGTQKEFTTTTQITPKAINVPLTYLHSGADASGSDNKLSVAEKHPNAQNDSNLEGFSDDIPVYASVWNYNKNSLASKSYFEKATFTMEYPAGVYLVKDTMHCVPAGYTGKIVNGVTDTIKGVPKHEPGSEVKADIISDHLSVWWEESADGGGKIIWYVTNGTMEHDNNGQSVGAVFRARTSEPAPNDNGIKTYYTHESRIKLENEKYGNQYVREYGAGEIPGFFIKLSDYVRNGRAYNGDWLHFTRTLIDGTTGKNVSLTAMNYTRRDITADFFDSDYQPCDCEALDSFPGRIIHTCGKENYQYALGGFKVKAELPYEDNTFLFINNPEGVGGDPGDLKITALNLMGDNIKDIKVVIYDSATNSYSITSISQAQLEKVETNPNFYNGQNCGTLLDLRNPTEKSNITPLTDTQYIKACLFTTDLAAFEYNADWVHSSFVYIGEFQNNQEDDQNREADVVLMQLNDGTSWADIKEELYNYELNLDPENVPTGLRADWSKYVLLRENDGQPVTATDHTSIGWNNTGVGEVINEVVRLGPQNDDKAFMWPNEIQFTTTIFSGYSFVTQDMLLDPVLYICLPKGLSLETDADGNFVVNATSVAGINTGGSIPLHVEYMGDRKIDTKGIDFAIYRCSLYDENKLSLIAQESLKFGASSSNTEKISATFKVKVEKTCPAYMLDMRDMILWDVRNAAKDVDDAEPKDVLAQSAWHSSWNSYFIAADKYDFVGQDEGYRVACRTGSIETKPVENLQVDLKIAPVNDRSVTPADDEFESFEGKSDQIAAVLPRQYADVKLTYLSTNDEPFFQNSVIYVPIPKKDQNYQHYFQNMVIKDPDHADTKNRRDFEYTMALTDSVDLIVDGATGEDAKIWKTWYGIDPLVTQAPHKESDDIDPGDWIPVKSATSGANYVWLDEAAIEDYAYINYDDVVMLKFELLKGKEIDPGSSGTAIMRLQVPDENTISGLDEGVDEGLQNYWRAYSKAVTHAETKRGDWSFSSIVATTPAVETLVGQIFVDEDMDGNFDLVDENLDGKFDQVDENQDGKYDSYKGEPGYTYSPSGSDFSHYRVVLHDSGGTSGKRELKVDPDTGAFALVDDQGKPVYLPAGDYKVEVTRERDPDFVFANTVYGEGVTSPKSTVVGEKEVWYNNVSSADGLVAIYEIKVTNERTVTHRVGIGVKPVVSAKINGKKTLSGMRLLNNQFEFQLKEKTTDGAVLQTAKNNIDGRFFFDLAYSIDTENTIDEVKTDHKYVVEEVRKIAGGIVYDEHSVPVTVTIKENTARPGALLAEVEYDNSDGKTEIDKAVTDAAAFTNVAGVELPITGGAGTYPYTLGGVLLIMAAGALWVYHEKTKRRRGRR